MKKALLIIGLIFGTLFLIVIFTAFGIIGMVKTTYNNLTTERVTAQRTNSDIDAQLQRRFDLINQTVGATKGALVHEEKIFADISKQQAAFTQAHNAGNVQGELNADAAATTSLGALFRGYFVAQMQYPNEQALESVKNLQVDIEGSENRISVARQRYNDSVQTYNSDLNIFPNNIIAGYFHFIPMEFYKNDAQSNVAPTVNLQ